LLTKGHIWPVNSSIARYDEAMVFSYVRDREKKKKKKVHRKGNGTPPVPGGSEEGWKRKGSESSGNTTDGKPDMFTRVKKEKKCF